MLGLQETRPAGTSSTKSYSCVACSATFHGLASLLVHQASHASELSSPLGSTSPVCSHCGGLFASKELLDTHQCMLVPPPVNQDLHICECGERFHDICAIQEHKKTHEMKTSTEPDNVSSIKIEVMTDVCHSAPVLSAENSMSNGTKESLHVHPQTLSETEGKKDCVSTSNVAPLQNLLSGGQQDGLLQTRVSSPMISKYARSDFFKNNDKLEEDEDLSSSDGEESQKQSTVTNKKTLLKMLASAYMSHRHPAQIQWGQNKRALPPRKVSPRAPAQSPESMSTSNPECSVNQLRQKVAKCVPSRDGCILSHKIFSNKRSVISVTKALCPVVALETRQKLYRDNVEGRYQCGICRKVFQSKDSLIIHHALHRKERVKFCRRCQEFVISVISVPDSHICTGSAGTANSFLTVMYRQKLFHCKLCNRSYTRRHRLKTHKCQWLSASARRDATARNIRWRPNAREQDFSIRDSTSHVNVAVNTEVNSIKTEESAESPEKDKIQMNTNSFKSETSPKSFPPFLPNKSKFASVESKKNVNETLKREKSINSSSSESEERVESNTEGSELLQRGQWTIPLDDAEIDVLTDEENCNNLEEALKENTDDEVIILEPSVNCGTTNSTPTIKDYQVHVSDGGIRRFSCNRCQKSYSRRFTLNQHLMICRSRKLMEPNTYGNMSANILGMKKKFPCPHCGSSFTRKDNMNMHRKRCQSMRGTKTLEGNGMLEKQNQAAQGNMFVLPPVSKSQVNQEGTSNVGGRSWGIMSLPSVLPRKVTCECGASFTCPRLLFEHLQMHALESYICSHCGENLQSWADFEAHQQLHLQTSRPKTDDKGSQQQSHIQPPFQQEPNMQTTVQNSKETQDQFKSRLNHRRITGPYVCHRCKKIFRLRKSLLRHLTRSCKGDTTTENKHCCSRCGMTFQNSLAQDIHMRGNTCTPAFKPLRCPVCVRWFSSLEGLKRHLLSHSQEESLTCQICGQKCSSHAALEEHKRSVHNINKGSESPTVQSAHVSQSSSSDAFRCQICQRSYPKLQSLKDHLRKVHRPKHLNPGSVGNFEFKELSRGIVQHSQSKQFQCHVCNRTYQDNQSLKNHRRRVHRILGGGLQPSRGNLQQSHSNPFQCQICSRTYPDIRSLRNHRRRVHRILGGLGLEIYKGSTPQNQGSLFKCQICQRSYLDIEALNNHKRKEHCILRDVLESTDTDATHMEQSQSDVFHVPDPSGNFEAIA
ncbi:zinc finger protein 62 homolog [Tachysurus fulvidraco]|uniref:zinc finger protein 62 homolog n=1 Tax=Tachysurus fulvidraco TaxID=1234273 RepID=UPI000F5016F6|nr:zinc finger protein 62 homolog [Tachysurus fulvidraco]XP_027009536.1 zinc finger protein 62 homolog [Tachysurus fulvidraco]